MTDPTAADAKLLPCPTCKSETPDWRNLVYSDEGRPQFCRDPYHPRPKPAPPAGGPDFHRWLDQKIAEWSAAGGFHDFAVAAKVIRDRLGLAAPPAGEPDWDTLARKYYTDSGDRMIEGLRYAYSLGLAARPKVEDGEVVDACQSLRSAARDSMQRKEYDVKPGNHWLEKIADLLERLMRDKQFAFMQQQVLLDGRLAADARETDQRRRADTAEAELVSIAKDTTLDGDGRPKLGYDAACAVKRLVERQQRKVL